MDHTVAEFEAKLRTFYLGCQEINASKTGVNKATDWALMRGKRYVRIVRERAAHCFVDSTNGDVLKSHGWASPRHGARGNIFDDE